MDTAAHCTAAAVIAAITCTWIPTLLTVTAGLEWSLTGHLATDRGRVEL